MFDYLLVLELAAVGSLVVQAIRLSFNPDPDDLVNDLQSWVVIGTVMVLFIYWRLARPGAWFTARHRFILGAVVLLILGGITFIWARAFTLALRSSPVLGDGVSAIIVQGSVLLLLAIGLLTLRRYALARGWLTLVSRSVLVIGLVLFLVYLGHDERVGASIGRNRTAMAGRCEDNASYLLTLRYTPGVPGAHVFKVPSRKLEFGQSGEKRTSYLQAHQSELAANWEELADVRAWWAEMAAQAELGDQAKPSFDQPHIRFAPVRAYAQHALALASLKALDGDGDGALAMVGDVYVVAMRLEPASCTLVRGMIAVVTQKQALETAEFVLEHSQVSAEARARFAGILVGRQGGGSGAKQLVLMDVTNFFGTAEGMSQLKGVSGWPAKDEHWPMWFARTVTGLAYFVTLNPQATSNRIHDYYGRLADLAEARDLAGIKKLEEGVRREQLGGFQIKNLSGRMLVQMSVPSLGKVVQSYWEVEDRQAALEKRLREVPAAM